MKQETKWELSAGSTELHEAQKKASVLSIPARIILNEAGVSFFIKHRQPLSRFEDSDGGSRFGFVMETIMLPWLKKMLLNGFVEKIEMEIFEIARSSEVLSDAVRLVFFAMFRHRITLSLLEHIYNSPMLRSWNRSNPKQSIGPGVNLSKRTIWAVLKPHKALVADIQLRLQKEIDTKIDRIKSKWDNEEKLALFIDEVVQDLDPLIFFILVGSKDEDRLTLIRNIASQITAFANMVDVLDMASLLSIELAGAAERNALLRVMSQQNMYNTFKDIPHLRSLMKEVRFTGTAIVISIPRYARKDGRRLKFRLSFYNDASSIDTERRLVEDFTERNGRFGPEKKLDDYFSERAGYNDNAMRFYYLTMLRQLCDKHNIKMSSGVSAAKDSHNDISGASVTTLAFGF